MSKRLLVHVEGHTEEMFVNRFLGPHLYAGHGYVEVSASKLGKRGGISKWESARRDIVRNMKNDRTILCTTMIDYYGMPQRWPGRKDAEKLSTARQKATAVQDGMLDAVLKEINDYPKRFIPYVVMHEFEGLLFSDPVRFAQSLDRSDLEHKFCAIRDSFSTPEDINDHEHRAPSKRIKDLVRDYQKILHGYRAMSQITLDAVRRACPLFGKWIQQLEQLA